jgi:hypothetical protein
VVNRNRKKSPPRQYGFNNSIKPQQVRYGEFFPQNYQSSYCQPPLSSYPNSHEGGNSLLPQNPNSLNSYEFPAVSMNNENYQPSYCQPPISSYPNSHEGGNSLLSQNPNTLDSYEFPAVSMNKENYISRPALKKSHRALPIVDPKTGKPIDIKSLLKARLEKQKEEKNPDPASQTETEVELEEQKEEKNPDLAIQTENEEELEEQKEEKNPDPAS